MLALRALSELAFPAAGHTEVIFLLLSASYGADTEGAGKQGNGRADVVVPNRLQDFMYIIGAALGRLHFVYE